MITIIAEKPSVARELAKTVGANSRKDGYIEGNGYYVTWAFGHLVQINAPESEGKWSIERLPIIPEKFEIRPTGKKDKDGRMKTDPGVAKQLETIGQLFEKSESIIVATDAGREGELIFRYIYTYLKCSKPFRRLWISSLTEKAIREGMNDLRPGNEFDNLYESAKARSEADWIVGINATEALTLAAGKGLMSLGRVQTPTLAMICSRYREHNDFIPKPFWTLSCPTSFHKANLTVQSTERYDDRKDAEADRDRAAKARIMRVTSVEKKEKRTQPPLLYDLTSLQKEANTRHGMTAERTLAAAQALYEKKMITYPRTGSRYITEDVFETIPALISFLKCDEKFRQAAEKCIIVRRGVDDNKVTDHHALLVTGEKAEDLKSDEQKIYRMIATRMMETFSGTCIEEVTTINTSAGGVTFKAAGTVIIVPGWKAIRELTQDTEDKKHDKNNTDDEEECRQKLPPLKEGDVLPVRTIEIKEGQTKPKPIHTEASLLAAMETAGKDAEDEEIREALKDTGLGTPATRASIIETLIKRTYIIRDGRKLIPTNLGMTVYDLVKDKRIAGAEETGRWENQLNRIARGEQKASEFGEKIREFATSTTKELLKSEIKADVEKAIQEDNRPILCPKCGKTMKKWPKNIRCNDCGLNIWTEICGKQLPEKAVRDLTEKGITGKIAGFTSKSGKKFSARLKLDKEYKTQFIFDK